MISARSARAIFIVALILVIATAFVPAQAQEAVKHADTMASTTVEAPPTVWDIVFIPKYILMMTLMLVGLLLLLLRRINVWVRVVGLLFMFVLFGIDYFYPLHPSPMCATTKLFMFRFTHGTWFLGMLAFFLVIFVPSLLGRKLFCGWVCPLGALQELVNKIPFKWRWKQFNFAAFNGLRLGLLVMFVLTFFWVKDHLAALGEETGMAGTPLWKAYSSYSIYNPINYFEFLHWSNIDVMFVIMMGILVIASLMLYRPFCYSICPIGALSWLLEKIAPLKVRVNRGLCNDCGVCVIKSPCPTIAPLLKGDRIGLPDCTSCGECLDTCPKNAIKFGWRA